jgi:hypothetical protein
MKTFKDAELTQELTSLDLGTVDAGSTGRLTFYLHNENDCHVKNIGLSFANKEVNLVSSPKDLKPFEKAEVVIEWAASVTTKKGLKTFVEIKFHEIWE